ncbi:MAG: asparagine synthase (glutamine-hydrolyzing) [Pyrinomonadaceae bacterium]|nr:asparagine synthase (glutamine-hydrolyzing) [Pyrinomonadaceae bacterium]
MCGIAGIFGSNWNLSQLEAMVARQHHRGPDARGLHVDATRRAGLGHNRLSIIDLSEAGRQPMAGPEDRLWIVFNGEIYNYPELRAELGDYPYRSKTDTEVVLAAYERWGEACLDHFTGMFAFLIWDEREGRLFAARDRFGVKPLNYHQQPDGTLLVASEIKALHAAGVPARPDSVAWSTYLTFGASDHSERTFWEGIVSLPPGHTLVWQNGKTIISRWYDLAERVGPELDRRSLPTVQEEYLALLNDSVRLRFRSDVPVGINLSGGLDSSTLLGLVQKAQGAESDVKAFTFATGDPRYDELPWVEQMLRRTRHPSVICRLEPGDVPELAASVQVYQDEPFGGLPTLCYAKLFETARAEGVIVLLDGQGMDEQWAGYDYYLPAADGAAAGSLVQGTREKPVRADCLTPEFRELAEPFKSPQVFPDELRNLQYRDVRHTKIPRALRFNDRVSMRASTELREPFLDHRLFELAFRQPFERKIVNGTRKVLLRRTTRQLLPDGVVEAPKRPLQTPQREWLRGSLRQWAGDCIEDALAAYGGMWLDANAVRETWQSYCGGAGDNSFYVWQWVNMGLMVENEVT